MNYNFDVQNHIEGLAQKNRISSFYPQTISRALNIPIEIVVNELDKLIGLGWLKLTYEVKCDDGAHTIAEVSDFREILNTVVFCDLCEENVEINYNNIYPVYHITESYKANLTKKNSL